MKKKKGCGFIDSFESEEESEQEKLDRVLGADSGDDVDYEPKSADEDDEYDHYISDDEPKVIDEIFMRLI